MDEAFGIAERQHRAAKLDDLFGSVRGDIARTRNHGALAFDFQALGAQHVLQEVDGAIAGCFGADQRATPFETLAGQHAGELVGDALVLAEHIANFAAANADIAGRHVDIGTDVTIKFGHEALAEAHDFIGALALGVEVRAALAAAHRQASQRVLEGLFKGEELQNAFGHRRVETDAALVRPDGVVVLHAPAALDADVALVVFPANTERNDAVGFGNAAQDLRFMVFFLAAHEFEDVLGDFSHRLYEFWLARITLLHPIDKARQVHVLA